VKSWRYRPYIIEGQPREFRTTIEVDFNQTSAINPLSFLHSHSKKELASVKSSEDAGAP